MNAVSRDWRVGDVVGTVVRALDAPIVLHEPAWYVLQVMAGSEETVMDRLKRLPVRWRHAMSVYCPYADMRIPKRRRRGIDIPAKTVRRPAFAGYLFIGVRNESLFPMIKAVQGAIDFIHDAGSPIQIRTRIIEMIRIAEDLGSLNEPVPTIKLQVGEHVLISDGIFRGYPATIIALPEGEIPLDEASEHVATVAINVLGCETPCKIPIDKIERT